MIFVRGPEYTVVSDTPCEPIVFRGTFGYTYVEKERVANALRVLENWEKAVTYLRFTSDSSPLISASQGTPIPASLGDYLFAHQGNYQTASEGDEGKD